MRRPFQGCEADRPKAYGVTGLYIIFILCWASAGAEPQAAMARGILCTAGATIRQLLGDNRVHNTR